MKSNTKKKNRVVHPLFLIYNLEELARELGRSEEYLLTLKKGRRPCGVHFRHLASQALRRPESELFMEEKADANRE